MSTNFPDGGPYLRGCYTSTIQVQYRICCYFRLGRPRCCLPFFKIIEKTSFKDGFLPFSLVGVLSVFPLVGVLFVFPLVGVHLVFPLVGVHLVFSSGSTSFLPILIDFSLGESRHCSEHFLSNFSSASDVSSLNSQMSTKESLLSISWSVLPNIFALFRGCEALRFCGRGLHSFLFGGDFVKGPFRVSGALELDGEVRIGDLIGVGDLVDVSPLLCFNLHCGHSHSPVDFGDEEKHINVCTYWRDQRLQGHCIELYIYLE